jgi:hypothetical protein
MGIKSLEIQLKKQDGGFPNPGNGVPNPCNKVQNLRSLSFFGGFQAFKA